MLRGSDTLNHHRVDTIVGRGIFRTKSVENAQLSSL